MIKEVYRYGFKSDVSPDDIEASLVLAVLATESLYGEPQVRLDAAHYLDRDGRACVIDASTAVGRNLNRLFVGFLNREFGANSFTVERVDELRQPQESKT
jgi:hypothetical protein